MSDQDLDTGMQLESGGSNNIYSRIVSPGVPPWKIKTDDLLNIEGYINVTKAEVSKL